MHARYVELLSEPIDATSRSFKVPDEKSLTRGFYMLWAVTNAGIPSQAVWARVP
jgi:hypothetical protein